ncbi:hypothetical protein QEZ48_08410 [Aquamicrobium lusatiense]|nr:hypothetical protein [Aquamicrobium lusatiense]MDH4990852.1 hypothetical protein [Aquamicrobium lusatiense]
MALFTIANLVVGAVGTFISGLGAVGTPLLSTNFEEYNPEGCE